MFFISHINLMQHSTICNRIESMSSTRRQNQNQNQANLRVSSPFCKVCKDAGLPEREYTSHFVKDRPGPNGKVVCPTLLNQSCLICGNKGHTSSYCTQNQNQNQNHRQPQKPVYVPYAHPHGPRIRLQLDATSLSSYGLMSCVDGAEAMAEASGQMISLVPTVDIDVRKINLMHEQFWGDEPIVHMNEGFQKIAEDSFMRTLVTDEEYIFIVSEENNHRNRPIFECE